VIGIVTEPIPQGPNDGPRLVRHELDRLLAELRRGFADAFQASFHGIPGFLIRRKTRAVHPCDITADGAAILDNILKTKERPGRGHV